MGNFSISREQYCFPRPLLATHIPLFKLGSNCEGEVYSKQTSAHPWPIQCSILFSTVGNSMAEGAVSRYGELGVAAKAGTTCNSTFLVAFLWQLALQHILALILEIMFRPHN